MILVAIPLILHRLSNSNTEFQEMTKKTSIFSCKKHKKIQKFCHQNPLKR